MIDNVLVIKAKQHYGKIFHGRGHDEPLHDIINAKGTFYYFNRGRYVTGTWHKGKVAEPFTFTLADGRRSRWRPARPSSSFPIPTRRFTSWPETVRCTASRGDPRRARGSRLKSTRWQPFRVRVVCPRCGGPR